jgi:hypothetical protein
MGIFSSFGKLGFVNAVLQAEDGKKASDLLVVP